MPMSPAQKVEREALLQRVLGLVAGGVAKASQLCKAAGVSARSMRELLRQLRRRGALAALKVDGHMWHWHTVEQLPAARAALASQVRARKQRHWARSNRARRMARPIKVPRGHGEEVRRVIDEPYRRLVKTAPASVWEYAGAAGGKGQ